MPYFSDARSKELFTYTWMVRDLVRGYIPDAWLRGLDYSTLEMVSSHFVSPDGQQRSSDVVWRVRVDGEWLYLYILMEFQNKVDPYMAVRMMTYVGLLYQHLIRQDVVRAGRRLPAVLPIVVSTGKARWTAETNIGALLPEVTGIVQRYLPYAAYLLIDNTCLDPTDPGDTLNLVALAFSIERASSIDEYLDAVRRIRSVVPDGSELGQTFVRFVRESPGVRGLEKQLHEIDNMENIEMTLLEMIEKKAQERADEREPELAREITEQVTRQVTQQLTQQVTQQAKLKADRAYTLSLLTVRFGKLPAGYERRIATASSEDCFGWGASFDAKTLDAVFESNPVQLIVSND